MKVLIYRIGQLGDTVIALPALWAVRRAFPDATLTYLASEHPGSGYVLARSVLPEGLIDEWQTYSLKSTGRLGGMLRLLWTLRRQRFDVLIYLAPRLRTWSSVRRDMLFFRLCGIRRVVGDRGFEPLPARRPHEPLPSCKHEADHLLHRLALGGIPVPAEGEGKLNLALAPQEGQRAEEWLRRHVPGFSGNVDIVGIGPGSKWPSKIWFEERFAELGSRLVREFGLFPVVFGGPEDAAKAERLIGVWGVGANAAGELDIRSAAAALGHCRFYVGNDTGTMHLAAAVGTPCVAIFAAQDWPGRWSPYGLGHIVLRQPVTCEGCCLSVCTTEGMRCLKEIGTADVVDACRAVLGVDRAVRNAGSRHSVSRSQGIG